MTEEEIKATLRDAGYSLQMLTKVSKHGNGCSSTSVVASTRINGRSVGRSLGTLDQVAAMSKEQIQAKIAEKFADVYGPKEAAT